MGEIDALNASLSRANELVNLANLKLAHVKYDIALNRYELSVAKRNLTPAASRSRSASSRSTRPAGPRRSR